MVPEMKAPRAPAWIGIGAQRSGTTWFTHLLLRHPAVCLASGKGTFIQRKELHFFDRVLHSGLDANFVEAYHENFAVVEASHPGEFTPSYLRCTWTAGLVRQAITPETIIVCLLRDPVERFYSAIRRSQQESKRANKLEQLTKRRGELSRLIGGDALWGGMYASQLRAWRAVFAVQPFIVLQYEAVLKDPATAVERVWSAMELAPVDIGPAQPLSESSSAHKPWTHDLRQMPDLRMLLQTIYHPEVLELTRDWGIESELWTSAWL